MFTVAIKIESLEKRKKNAALLHIAAGCFLIAKSATYYEYMRGDLTPVLPFFAIASLMVLYGLLRKRLDPDGRYNNALRILEILVFLVLGFLLLKQNASPFDHIGCFIMSMIGLMLLLSEKHIYTDKELIISGDGITIPGDYKQHIIPWDVLSDVVIRSDYITIFHKNEKYLQYQVMQTLSELELAKMNGFCREQVDGVEAANN